MPIGDCFLIFGRVVLAAIATDVLDGELADARKLAPLARLGRDEWSTLGAISRNRPHQSP